MDKGISDWSFQERVGEQYSEEVRVTSGVPQGRILGPFVPSLCKRYMEEHSIKY
jgi:hypothetical protein